MSCGRWNTALDEFALIARYFRWPPQREQTRLAGGDDAALLAPPPGQVLVISTDTLLAGRHYDASIRPEDLGWKALAVNLSDLLAMAAEPLAFTLALSLPEADEAWLQGFAAGLRAHAQAASVDLIGGDTTRGPQAITITVFGAVPAAQALRRDGARPGQGVYVSGPLGDAALALRLGAQAPAALRRKLDRPEPPLRAWRGLRGHAAAGIDLSDGLSADLGHVLRASGVGATLEWAALPRSAAFAAAGATAALQRESLLHGGDDYELLVAADAEPPAPRPGQGWMRIGRIEAEPGLRLREQDGTVADLTPAAWTHF